MRQPIHREPAMLWSKNRKRDILIRLSLLILGIATLLPRSEVLIPGKARLRSTSVRLGYSRQRFTNTT